MPRRLTHKARTACSNATLIAPSCAWLRQAAPCKLGIDVGITAVGMFGRSGPTPPHPRVHLLPLASSTHPPAGMGSDGSGGTDPFFLTSGLSGAAAPLVGQEVGRLLLCLCVRRKGPSDASRRAMLQPGKIGEQIEAVAGKKQAWCMTARQADDCRQPTNPRKPAQAFSERLGKQRSTGCHRCRQTRRMRRAAQVQAGGHDVGGTHSTGPRRMACQQHPSGGSS